MRIGLLMLSCRIVQEEVNPLTVLCSVAHCSRLR